MASACARQLTFLSTFLACAVTAGAEERPWAEQMFDKLSHDFGVVARGGEAKYRFKVTSLWRDDTHIAHVATSCGCTAAVPAKRTLKSWESTHIEVTMDTNRFSYLKESTLTVTFDAPQYATVRLPIRAYILPDVVIEPASVDFGQVEQTNGAERVVRVSRSGNPGWTVKKVRTSSKHVSARVKEVSRSGHRVSYDLYATLEPTAPVGNLFEQIVLTADDRWAPSVSVLVKAQIESDVTVTPSLVSLGRLKPRQDKTFQLVVRMKRPFSVERVLYAANAETVQLTPPEGNKAVHVVSVAVKAPKEPGRFTADLTLTLTGRPEPVTARAYGIVVDDPPE